MLLLILLSMLLLPLMTYIHIYICILYTVVSTIKIVDVQFWHFTRNCCNLYCSFFLCDLISFFQFLQLFFFFFSILFFFKLHFAPQFKLLTLDDSNLTLSLSAVCRKGERARVRERSCRRANVSIEYSNLFTGVFQKNSNSDAYSAFAYSTIFLLRLQYYFTNVFVLFLFFSFHLFHCSIRFEEK